jgi:hypothetical protein
LQEPYEEDSVVMSPQQEILQVANDMDSLEVPHIVVVPSMMMYEYHILYSTTYNAPVLYFNVTLSGM